MAAVVLATPYFMAIAWLSGFAFSAAFAAVLALAMAMGGPALALGVLVSCVARRVRGAVLLFGAVVAILLAIDLAERVAGAVSTAAGQPGLLAYGRLTLATLAHALAWLSPFAYLSRLADPFTTSGAATYLQTAGGAILYTGILLALAVVALRWRGARP